MTRRTTVSVRRPGVSTARSPRVPAYYVQVPSTGEVQGWHTIAALIVVGTVLELEGQGGVRIVGHDELLRLGGPPALEAAYRDLASRDPALRRDPAAQSLEQRDQLARDLEPPARRERG